MANKTILFGTGSILMMLFLLFMTPCLYANGYDRQKDSKTSFKAENESLRSVLEKLSQHYDLNITYNASNEDLNLIINYTSEEISPEKILAEILHHIGYEYTTIGNQLVIHRSERFERLQSERNTYEGTANLPADTILRIIEIPVAIIDTVVIHETQKEVVYLAPAFTTNVRPLIVNRPAFRPLRVRNDRFSLSFSFAQMLAGYSMPDAEPLADELIAVRDAEGFSLRNSRLTAGFHYRFGALLLSTSIALNNYSTPFAYQELFISGGYHQVDTLDRFYTIINGEEQWVYITDSIYIPEESRLQLYDRTNNLGIMDFQFNLAYDVFISHNNRIFIHGGLQLGLPVWYRGNTIQDHKGYPSIPMNRDQFNDFVFGYHFGTGSRITLNSQLDLVVSADYKRYTQDIFKSHPLTRRMHGLSIQIGLQVYL